ncbi:T9SS type B sorting domain-containing protein [Flagellimonas myxillae]|uniref:T9SS type B sorting domain-containing protein n=1 Tax=Flagellimonas myxillae TaxID=2942214 RepID=UPI00201FA43D|nr:T9SS type B sorting domain-containing protein [Muricauda myxillae]MCL6265130.1 T9SS type B sorting domain-containing protein [Muricauda myxillae]
MLKSAMKLIGIAIFGQMTYGQVIPDCGSAVPICSNTPINGGTNGFGIDDFNGASSSGCLERTPSGNIESNSAWYRFRTSAAGQLGFNIGHANTEDWDFALYQATDCSNLGDPIRCNFFDNSDGVGFIGVGEDPSGVSDSVHYEDWLQVAPNEDYILVINNFSNSNSGFSIQFTGDIWTTNPTDALDCSIINNLLGPPVAACEGDTITLDATTPGALSYDWFSNTGSGFTPISGATLPTLNVTVSAQYRVVVGTPSGSIISDVQAVFSPIPITNAVSDEVFCHTSNMVYDLNGKDAEALGVQDPAEFLVSYHTSQAEALSGSNPLDKMYNKAQGLESVFVRLASRMNPDCFDASVSFELNALETPEPSFSTEATLCGDSANVVIGETMPNPGYMYQWSSGETTPSITVSQAGDYTVTVTNSASGINCAIDRTVSVFVSNAPQISVDIEFEDLKPNNTVNVEDLVEGDYEYRLDDGPYQSNNVFNEVSPGAHTITARDIYGCAEVVENFVVVGFLPIFSPNGDVLNETWQIEGLSVLDSPVVTIFDRYGKLIWEMTEFSPGWDGSFQGKPLPSTDYWFKLSYLDSVGNRIYAKHLQSHFSLRR